MDMLAPTTYRAIQVANYLVGLSLGGQRRLTNMALQKILYFAEGRHLAEKDRRLFGDRIEAWTYGPVVPTVYREFRRFGSQQITERVKTPDMTGSVRTWRWETPDVPITSDTEPDRHFLDAIWREYGGRSAIELMQESHEPGGPWSQLYTDTDRHVEIPPETLRAYFARQTA